FEQIAAWTESDVEKFDNELELTGRPQREDWVAKARILAAEKNA
ncbi:MAG: 50S ribosomal protein L21, partial [Rhizobiales bacterium]|nr:50S ribosomal protein L21 [Hyphomicrobiales bacterium]